MSDLLTTARSARESLARGLNALQADPNVPPQLLGAAAPIAQAMGALHLIEKSQGTQVQPHADAALANVRSALSQLQALPTSHPAVAMAVEAVASSLGMVNSLARSVPSAAMPPQAAYADTVAQAAPPRPPPPLPTAQQYQAAPAAPNAPVPAPPAGNLPTVEAPLGAHSPTNFYKGLSGNDIVDHGGLFVSTYKIPRIGTNVRLKVSLPGGYEFEANAIVRWSREASDGSPDAPPGFGAQFTQITPEARQLIYRYVRNREPLFHDDL